MSRAPGRPRVVLLHGVGLDRSIWRPLREHLDPERYDVAAPDLLGHGDAPPAPGDTGLADLAAAVLPDLGPGTHVVGFSLGALVTQHLAIHHPDRVASATFVSSVCRRTPAERAAVLARLDAAEADFPASVEASLQRWYAGTDVPADVVADTERILRANDIPSYLACYRVFATADAEVADDLPRIAVPTLAITGSDDPGSTPQMSERLGAAIPGCRVIVLPETRHMLPVQRPAELASALTTFIEEQ